MSVIQGFTDLANSARIMAELNGAIAARDFPKVASIVAPPAAKDKALLGEHQMAFVARSVTKVTEEIIKSGKLDELPAMSAALKKVKPLHDAISPVVVRAAAQLESDKRAQELAALVVAVSKCECLQVAINPSAICYCIGHMARR